MTRGGTASGGGAAGAQPAAAHAHLSRWHLLRPEDEGAQWLGFHLQGEGECGQENWLVETVIG